MCYPYFCNSFASVYFFSPLHGLNQGVFLNSFVLVLFVCLFFSKLLSKCSAKKVAATFAIPKACLINGQFINITLIHCGKVVSSKPE